MLRRQLYKRGYFLHTYPEWSTIPIHWESTNTPRRGNKASGPDNIPCRVLKQLAQELSPVVTAICCQSLETGILPVDWNEAIISPIYKKGNVHLAANYRPVSLTNVVCKIMEHIICKHILNHLDLHNILSAFQHGGFPGAHSCECQLLLPYCDWPSVFIWQEDTDWRGHTGYLTCSWHHTIWTSTAEAPLLWHSMVVEFNVPLDTV